MIRITPREMQDFSRYIAEISGIALDRDKKYLLENRLQSLLDAQGCTSFQDLLFSAKTAENGDLRGRVIDAITTNETYFFRDHLPFEILRHKIIPEIIDRKRRPAQAGKAQIRIWCAGCSTGQEVYSVIMAILETLSHVGGYDIRVLGTDISSRVVARASAGRYSQHEVERGLPEQLLHKYFVAENGFWRIRDEVRMLASFSRMNLLEPFYGIGPFDIIFCRNVSIYFSESNKGELFRKIARILNRDGYLIVGGSESLSEVAPQFICRRHLKGMYYQRKDAVGAPLVPAQQATGFSPAAGQGTARNVVPPSPVEPAAFGAASPPPEGSASRPERQQRIAAAARKRPAPPAARHAGFPPETVEVEDMSPGSRLAEGVKASVAQPRALLESILDHQERGDGLLARRERKPGEGERSLLEIVWRRNAGKADDSDQDRKE
ncbi:MAG: CheR family methyltransferase [Desulfobulbaceae bacterium]